MTHATGTTGTTDTTDTADEVDDRASRAVAAQQASLPSVWQALDRGILGATNLALFGIGSVFTVIVTAEVVSRYVFSHSIFFVNSGARLLLVWFFMVGAGVALRHNAHVGFELIVTRLQGRRRRAMLTLAYACSLIFFVEMIWGGVYSIAPAIPQNEAGLGVSVVWFVLAVPAGFVLLAYHVVVLLAVLWRQPLEPAGAS